MRPATPSTDIDLNPFIDAIREDQVDSKATFIEAIMGVITRKRGGSLDAEEKAICRPYIGCFYTLFIKTKKSPSLYATLKPRYAGLLNYNISLSLEEIGKRALAEDPETPLSTTRASAASSGLFSGSTSSARSSEEALSTRKSLGYT